MSTPQVVLLTAATGSHVPTAVVAATGKPRGAIVILHEAFAVTASLLRVAEDYAKQGYLCLLPDLFTPEREAETARHENTDLWRTDGPLPSLPINKRGLDWARANIAAVAPAEFLARLQAPLAWLKANHPGMPVALMGFCFGGSMAYVGATHLKNQVAASVAYYGGQLQHAPKVGQPSCPTLVHLAKLDQYIPCDEAKAALNTHHPAAEVHLYDADHGFNRDDGVTFDPAAATLARTRTLEFLAKNLG